jgi:hypothetical protein
VSSEDFRDREFAESIAADVLGVLRDNHFFELLDGRFCPVDPGQPRATCGHSFANTLAILAQLGMNSNEVEDVLDVMRHSGGCCDCEILYNVAEESRLKSEYWKARHRELTPET